MDIRVRQRSIGGEQANLETRDQNSKTERKINNAENSSTDDAQETPFVSDLECETSPMGDITKGTNHVPGCMEKICSGLSPRISNLVVRTCTSIFMIGGFATLVYLGPLALVVLVLLLQMSCFHEIIHIGYVVYRSHELPMFRTLSWMFLFTSNYFLFGESLITRFRILLAKEDFLSPLVVHHRFISFSLYFCCIIAFILSLVRRHYLKQFTLFGWTHVTLLLIVVSSHFLIQSIFEGLIWFLIPVSMVISNDIMAYIFGIMFGKTPLIKLSPKKTWEGFIGGGISSLLLGIVFSYAIIDNKHFICPIEYDDKVGELSMDCIIDPIFIPHIYNVSKWLFFVPLKQFNWYPYNWHCIVIGLFVSCIGPFGGFFASGFKRAFKIKDFGDTIPGHGGVMDRFDCQVFIGWFVFFYYNSFIKLTSPKNLLQQIFVMSPTEQLTYLSMFIDGLERRGVMPSILAAPILAYVEKTKKENEASQSIT